jgi:vacuolar-type H+-ATPase subunit C/Vma6
MLADQHLNMAQAVSRRFGIQLDFANITAKSLEWALKEVLENSRYCVCTIFYNIIHTWTSPCIAQPILQILYKFDIDNFHQMLRASSDFQLN